MRTKKCEPVMIPAEVELFKCLIDIIDATGEFRLYFIKQIFQVIKERKIFKLALLFAMLIFILIPFATVAKEVNKMAEMIITSPTFEQNKPIPERHTCDGLDINPPLQIKAVPDGTKSLAVIMDDPDAPVSIWAHWLVWNIPSQTREINENSLPAGAVLGLNSWKRNSYEGPCPPSGIHRYFFKFYALDTTLNLSPATIKADLERVMRGHILAQAELMGTYKRK